MKPGANTQASCNLAAAAFLEKLHSASNYGQTCLLPGVHILDPLACFSTYQASLVYHMHKVSSSLLVLCSMLGTLSQISAEPKVSGSALLQILIQLA